MIPQNAQTIEGAKAPDDRATSFEAVEGGRESKSGETLLVAAYASLWLILLGYVLFLWRKQRSLETRLDDLESAAARRA